LTQLFSAKTLGVDESEVKDRSAAGNDEDNEDEEDEDGEVNFSTIKSSFAHDKDAVDFSEINDLAVDTEQEMFSSRYLQKGLSAVKSTATTAMKSSLGKSTSRLDSVDEDYDAEETDEEGTSKDSAGSRQPSGQPALSLLERQQLYLQQEQQKLQQASGGAVAKPLLPVPSLPAGAAPASDSASARTIDVHALYPAFEKDKILKFSDLFNTKRPKRFPHSRAKLGTGNVACKRMRRSGM